MIYFFLFIIISFNFYSDSNTNVLIKNLSINHYIKNKSKYNEIHILCKGTVN